MSKAFISYSWDSEEHKAWAKRVADGLIESSIEVIIDQYELQPGDDKHVFMEQATMQAGHIIIICSTLYKRKADDRTGGVGEETSLITPGFYERNKTGKRFIPIKNCQDEFSSVLPKYLGSIIGIDFDNVDFQSKIDELIKTIKGEPLLEKPQLGSRHNILTSQVVPTTYTPVPSGAANHRHLTQSLKEQIATHIPQDTKVSITCILGDGEAFAFAQEILDYLRESGTDASGVNQAIYNKPVMGQIINQTSEGVEIVIGTNA